jgi:hypothetical protein
LLSFVIAQLFRLAGEVSTATKGKRYALHHMIAGKLG